MIATLVSLLVVVIVVGVLYWALHRFLWAIFGLPAIVLTVVDVVLVLIAVFFILRAARLIGP